MPFKDWNVAETWHSAYDDGRGRHYERSWLGPERLRGRHAEFLIKRYDLSGPNNFDSYVVIDGAGFGWLAEALRSRGIHTVLANETSEYINSHPNKATEGPDLSLAADISRRQGRTSLSSLSGERCRLLLSESVIEVLTDAELTADKGYLASIDALAGQYTNQPDPPGLTVVHLVKSAEANTAVELDGSRTRNGHVVQDSGYNWKTLAEWRSFLNTAGFNGHELIDVTTLEVT